VCATYSILSGSFPLPVPASKTLPIDINGEPPSYNYFYTFPDGYDSQELTVFTWDAGCNWTSSYRIVDDGDDYNSDLISSVLQCDPWSLVMTRAVFFNLEQVGVLQISVVAGNCP
jgi:hypothetical protein